MEQGQLIQRALFGVSPDGTPSIVGTWFGFTNFTLTTVVFGISFLLACIATAAYYVLVVVTEPSQQVKRKRRSKTDAVNWDFQRILRLLHFAYTTYSTLDLENLTCQKRILCEFQESSGIIGSTTRRISNFLMYFNFFKSFPKIKQYQEAINIGQRSTWRKSRIEYQSQMRSSANETISIEPHKLTPEPEPPSPSPTCSDYFNDCGFSVHKFNEYYNKVFYNIID